MDGVAADGAGGREATRPSPCKRYLCKMTAEEGHDLCEFCERELMGLARTTGPALFIPLIPDVKGIHVTKAFRDDQYERGYYIERHVDAKGDVTTQPLSKRAGSRLYFHGR